jgi:glycosyltransferase involved in cell wall biosynthesis
MAIACFQAQSYDPRELLILDDGESVRDLIPDDERIRYFHYPARMVLGEKRNLACELARGEVICHWDDDDWSAADRIEHQLSAMESSGKPMTGFHSLLYFDEPKREAWHFRGPSDWVVGSSLCYLKSIWAYDPFPRISEGEDSYMVLRAQARMQLCCTSGVDKLISRRHAANSSAFENHLLYCERVSVDSLPEEFTAGIAGVV